MMNTQHQKNGEAARDMLLSAGFSPEQIMAIATIAHSVLDDLLAVIELVPARLIFHDKERKSVAQAVLAAILKISEGI